MPSLQQQKNTDSVKLPSCSAQAYQMLSRLAYEYPAILESCTSSLLQTTCCQSTLYNHASKQFLITKPLISEAVHM